MNVDKIHVLPFSPAPHYTYTLQVISRLFLPSPGIPPTLGCTFCTLPTLPRLPLPPIPDSCATYIGVHTRLPVLDYGRSFCRFLPPS